MELQLREAEQRKKLADNVSCASHVQIWALQCVSACWRLSAKKAPAHCAPSGQLAVEHCRAISQRLADRVLRRCLLNLSQCLESDAMI